MMAVASPGRFFSIGKAPTVVLFLLTNVLAAFGLTLKTNNLPLNTALSHFSYFGSVRILF